MSNDAGKQSSTEVEHEAEDVRAGLAHTLDQLRENLKPEHVMEEVVTNARFGASTLADSMYALARENPIPALLIGAGCAMILGVGARATSRSTPLLHVRPNDSSSAGKRSTRLGSVVRSFSASSGADKSSGLGASKSSGIPERSTWTSPSTAGRLSGGSDASSDRYDPTPTSRDVMSNFKVNMPRSAKQASSQLSGLLHDQPLVLAALGVAVGAAIGAALPTTDIEDEWMGGPSASLRQAAQEAARHEIDELKAAAGKTADQLRQSAADHGLSADNLNDLVRDAGEQAKSAIHGVGASVDTSQKKS